MKQTLLRIWAALFLVLLAGCSTSGGLNISNQSPHFNGFIGTTFSR